MYCGGGGECVCVDILYLAILGRPPVPLSLSPDSPREERRVYYPHPHHRHETLGYRTPEVEGRVDREQRHSGVHF